MTFLQSIIYGFVSGFSEFAPISSAAHQELMLYFWGIEAGTMDLFVHLGMFAALLASCRRLLARIRRDRLLSTRSSRKRRQALAGVYDMKIANTAAVPAIIGIIAGALFLKDGFSLMKMSLVLLANGLILFLTQFVHQGNKDGKTFAILDSIGMGIFGGLSGITGISRVGASVSYAIYRGADKTASYQWALLTGFPVLLSFMGMDILGIFSNTSSAVSFLLGMAGMAASYAGSYASIAFMRYLMVNIGISGFAYYSWGTALFTFIIYLLT